MCAGRSEPGVPVPVSDGDRRGCLNPLRAGDRVDPGDLAVSHREAHHRDGPPAPGGDHPRHSPHEHRYGCYQEGVALDLLDSSEVHKAVLDVHPDAIIHEATGLANAGFSRSLDRTFAGTNRLRTEGTDNLLAAAGEAGVRRLVAQSFAPYRYIREGSMIKAEYDALDPNPPRSASETFAAMTYVDQAFLSVGGIVLRYGGFYGAPDSMSRAVARRQYPIVGDGTGPMPFVHLNDATSATVLALEHEGPAVYNITDDDSAPMSEWLPALASALGARRPFRIPVASVSPSRSATWSWAGRW